MIYCICLSMKLIVEEIITGGLIFILNNQVRKRLKESKPLTGSVLRSLTKMHRVWTKRCTNTEKDIRIIMGHSSKCGKKLMD